MVGVQSPEMANAKVFTAQLKAGDSFRISAGGGGGFGPPWTRPVENVREDVRQGYVTPESAKSDYGVVLDPHTLEIDPDASAKLRARMAATVA
jgi:N-methylhydantoinase B